MADGGWHPDPLGTHQWRYWNGAAWTDDVYDGGTPASAPGAGPAAVAVRLSEQTSESIRLFIGIALVLIGTFVVLGMLLVPVESGSPFVECDRPIAELANKGTYLSDAEVVCHNDSVTHVKYAFVALVGLCAPGLVLATVTIIGRRRRLFRPVQAMPTVPSGQVQPSQAAQVPPPGWYPDTRAAGSERYWDGVRWTEQVRSTSPSPESPGPAAGPS